MNTAIKDVKSTEAVINNTDPISVADLVELAKLPAPVVSIVVPMHRAGSQTRDNAKQLRPHVEAATKALNAEYPEVDAPELLAGIEGLVRDERFWQEQVDSLVLFASPAGLRYFRLASSLDARSSVGEHADLSALLPLVANNQEFYLLALSRAKVRLFHGDHFHISELELGNIPQSEEEAEGVNTREPQFQHQSGSEAPAHGHGPRDYNVLEGFLSQVGKAVGARLRGVDAPIILASVEEYRGQIGAHVPLHPETITGNPDELSAKALHARAWPLAAALAQERHDELGERLGAELGTGRASVNPEKIAEEAAQGRVDTVVFAAPFLHRGGGQGEQASVVRQAVAETLRNGGHVDMLPEIHGGHEVGALFRF